jgi:hypothetical protein
MSKSIATIVSFVTLATAGLIPLAQTGVSQLDAVKLKELISNMGYDVKDLVKDPGKEKYSFDVKTTNFNIPIGAEISPSKNYVWLTANLGSASEVMSLPGRAESMLKSNGSIQPCFFYITSKGALMMGFPLDNRGIDPPTMKRCVEKLAKDVSDTGAIWQK